MMKFPLTRWRRLRQNNILQEAFSENKISTKKLIQPIFIIDKKTGKESISTMPGIFRFGFDPLFREIDDLLSLGIKTIALFPRISNDLKTSDGKESLNEKGLIPKALKELKKRYKDDLMVMCDVALDPYTDHGHDGLIDSSGYVLNDSTVFSLQKQALLLATNGADVLGPSDMMDGRIIKIRKTLEAHNFTNTVILSYAAKFSSSFYAPFRDAVGSNNAIKKKNKNQYQINPANSKEAINDALLDESEGADILMVKPALHYLDIIHQLKNQSKLPVAAYHTSGEYSMLKTAVNNKTLPPVAINETLLSFFRAGSSVVLSYFSKEFALTVSHETF